MIVGFCILYNTHSKKKTALDHNSPAVTRGLGHPKICLFQVFVPLKKFSPTVYGNVTIFGEGLEILI